MARDGRDGRDADPSLIRAEVERVISGLPFPEGRDGRDGRDIDTQAVLREFREAVANAGSDAEAVAAAIEQQTARLVDALKPGRWEFEVIRDDLGQMARVIATPLTG